MIIEGVADVKPQLFRAAAVLKSQLAWSTPLCHAIVIAVAALCGLVLAGLSPLDGLLLVFFGLVGLITVVEPLVGLLVTLFLGLLGAWLRAELPVGPPLIAMPVLAWTLGVWLLRGAARRQIHLPLSPLLGPLLLFIAAAGLSLWDGIELLAFGFPELLKWLQVLALFWFVVSTIDRQRLAWLVGGLLLIGLFQAFVGLWQFGLRGSGPEHFSIMNERLFRAYGTFEQPNPYAGYLGLVFPLGFGIVANWVLDRSISRPSIACCSLPLVNVFFLCLATGIIGAALVASWSRGAWLGAGAALVVMLVALPPRTWMGISIIIMLLVGILGLNAIDLLPASVSARLTDFAQYIQFEDVRGVGINDANYAVLERLAHWQAALEMWQANFWNGVGLGDYEPAYPDYRLLNWPVALGHAHNYYLNLAAETGLIGLAAYLLLWGGVLWRTWRLIQSLPGWSWWRGLAIGLLGSWTHLSVHHLFDNLYVNMVHLHIGVMLGLVALLALWTLPMRIKSA